MDERGRSKQFARHVALVAGVWLAVVACVAPMPGGSYRPYERLGVRVEGQSRFNVIDGGALIVVRTTAALVPDDTNARTDVHLWDRATDTYERQPAGFDGFQLDGDSTFVGLGAGRREVLLNTDATNALPGLPAGGQHLLIWDRDTGRYSRPLAPNGSIPDGRLLAGAEASPDGRFVPLLSDASQLAPGATNGHLDAYVWDRSTNTFDRLAAFPGASTIGDTFPLQVSPDGRYLLAYTSDTFVPGQAGHLIVWDRQTRSITEVPEGPGLGFPSSNLRYFPLGGLLGSCDLAPTVWDRVTGTQRTLPAAADGSAPFDATTCPVIQGVSDDGRYVALTSSSRSLVAGAPAGTEPLMYVADLTTGTYIVQPATTDGASPDGPSSPTGVSADGRRVTFVSAASNLVAGDSPGSPDLFIWDVGPRP